MKAIHTRALEKHLIARGLVPKECRLVEVTIAPSSALVVRYEVYVSAERLGLFADAMKAAADEELAIQAAQKSTVTVSESES